jgi:hypothetical protein
VGSVPFVEQAQPNPTQELRITSITITTVEGPVEIVHFVKAHLSQMKILSSKK